MVESTRSRALVMSAAKEGVFMIVPLMLRGIGFWIRGMYANWGLNVLEGVIFED